MAFSSTPDHTSYLHTSHRLSQREDCPSSVFQGAELAYLEEVIPGYSKTSGGQRAWIRNTLGICQRDTKKHFPPGSPLDNLINDLLYQPLLVQRFTAFITHFLL